MPTVSSLPEVSSPTPEEEHRLARQQRVASLLEVFFRVTQGLLVEDADSRPARKAAGRFLAARGFAREALEDLPLGWFSDRRTLGQRLLESGFSAEEIEASQLLADPRLSGRLVGPICDRDGRIVSFWARHPEDRPPRMLFKGHWKDQLGLFGLDTAFRPGAGGGEHLVIVEEILDAILLHSRGVWNVAALGGPVSGAGRRCWQRVAGLGVGRVTLAADPPHGDPQRIVDAVEPLQRAQSPPEVFLLLPGELDEHDRVAELIRQSTAEQFRSVLESASIPAYSCRTFTILERHPDDQPLAVSDGFCVVHRCPITACFCFD